MGTIDARKMNDFAHSWQSGLGVLEEGQQVKIAVVQDPREPETDSYDAGDSNKMSNEVKDSLEELVSEAGVGASTTEEGVVIRLDESVLFDSGVAAINKNAFSVLSAVIGVIGKISSPVRVEGHTDNIPIRTDRFPSNWELSVARAVNVVKHFVERGGILPQRLSVAGYGDSRPLVPNDTFENRARNRRVEIILLIKEGNQNVN
jgi:chemotaxis protein MotB